MSKICEIVDSSRKGEVILETLPPSAIDENKRGSPTQKFCSTVNNYTAEEFLFFHNWCLKNCSNFVIGKEIGESGTPHLQCWYLTYKKYRLITLRKLFGPKHHIEIQQYNNIQASQYCMKDDNWVGTEEPPYKGQDLILKKEFYDWQISALDIANIKEDRTINWIYENIGNTGKSKWCKYMIYHHDAIVITKGKYSDIMNYCYNCKTVKLIIFDLARIMGNRISYGAVEDLKNGIIVNTKYETGQKLILPPTIIILSNKYPDTENLSLDRWKIFEIIEKKLVEQDVY